MKSLLLISDVLKKPSSCSESVEIDTEVDGAVVKNISIKFPSLLIPFVTNDALDKVTSSFLERQYSDDLLSAIRQVVFNFFYDKFSDQRLNCILK